jgi:hypothetical protein
MRRKQLTHIQWITAVLLLASVQLKAQDTIRVFQYNLLRYGESSQPPANKNPLLKTIIDYTQPDIFGANEIASNSSYQYPEQRIEHWWCDQMEKRRIFYDRR